MELNDEILKIRKEYRQAILDESDTPNTPEPLFQEWFEAAVKADIPEPNAMVLSTADKHCRPSSRVVLFRGSQPEGIIFFTNYLSRKGNEIDTNPFGCINFFWPGLERQIRIEGKIAMTSEKLSDLYFEQRPRGSQISAWTSPQSKRIESRMHLEEMENEMLKSFASEPINRPKNWGGYALKPDYFEFWQGRENRLHDRICYQLNPGGWEKFRIAP